MSQSPSYANRANVRVCWNQLDMFCFGIFKWFRPLSGWCENLFSHVRSRISLRSSLRNVGQVCIGPLFTENLVLNSTSRRTFNILITCKQRANDKFDKW